MGKRDLEEARIRLGLRERFAASSPPGDLLQRLTTLADEAEDGTRMELLRECARWQVRFEVLLAIESAIAA